MTIISQQQPINILKPPILSTDKGSLSCVLVGQNLILTKVRFASCNSLTSVHFCRLINYRLSLFLLKAELGCYKMYVFQIRNPISPMLNQYQWHSLKQYFSFISVIMNS